jgi:hypothetical protein
MRIGPIHFRAKNYGARTLTTSCQHCAKPGPHRFMGEKKAPRRELLWRKYY